MGEQLHLYSFSIEGGRFSREIICAKATRVMCPLGTTTLALRGVHLHWCLVRDRDCRQPTFIFGGI